MGLNVIDRWAIKRVLKMLRDPEKRYDVGEIILREIIDRKSVEFMGIDNAVKMLAMIVHSYTVAWDIASAIRGPDFDDESLKIVFTDAVRRCLARLIGWSSKLPKVPFKYLIEWVVRVGDDHYHYLSHVYEALYHLSQLLDKDKHVECLEELAYGLQWLASCNEKFYRDDEHRIFLCNVNALNHLSRVVEACSEFITD